MKYKEDYISNINNYDLVVEIADSDDGSLKLNKISNTNEFITEINNMELKKVEYILYALLECNEQEIKINCRDEDIYVKIAYKAGNELEASMNIVDDEVIISWVNKDIEIKFKPIDENGVTYSKTHSKKLKSFF